MYTSGRQQLTYTCSLDLMMFPFDTQSCNITFSTMSSNGKYCKLSQITSRAIDVTIYSFFIVSIEKTIKLGTFNSDNVLNKVSAEAMVTMGEWELKSLITFNGSRARNRLRYMVRKYFCDGFFFVDSFLSHVQV